MGRAHGLGGGVDHRAHAKGRAHGCDRGLGFWRDQTGRGHARLVATRCGICRSRADRGGRATPVRRGSARRVARKGPGSASLGDDRHAHSEVPIPDAVRGFGRDGHRCVAPRSSAGSHGMAFCTRPRQGIAIFVQRIEPGPPSVHRVSPGLRIRKERSASRDRSFRGLAGRRAVRVSPGLAPRPAQARGKRGGDVGVQARGLGRAGDDDGDRSGRGCAQCHGDDGRTRRAVWAVAVAPVARPSGARSLPILLHFDRRSPRRAVGRRTRPPRRHGANDGWIRDFRSRFTHPRSRAYFRHATSRLSPVSLCGSRPR